MKKEKRMHQRIPVKVVAEWNKGDSKAFSHDAFVSFTKDISLSGAAIISKREIRNGEQIGLRFHIPDYFFPIIAFGEAVWTKDAWKALRTIQKVTEVGIKFKWMDRIDVQKMENFLMCRARYKLSNV